MMFRGFLARVLCLVGVSFCALSAYWSAKDDPREWTSLGLGVLVAGALLVMALMPPRS